MSKVSIAIPYYEKGRYIKRVLESIKDQDYTDFEVIVMCDGKPSSQAKKVILSYTEDKRFKYFEKDHSGAPATRNEAGDKATGNYILFWDADALMLPGGLRSYVRGLEENPECDFAYCAHRYSKDPKVASEDVINWDSRKFDAFDLEQANYIDTCSIMRMSLWAKLRWDETLKLLQDWDLFLQAVKTQGAKGHYINAHLFIKAWPEPGSISSVEPEAWSRGKKIVWEKHKVNVTPVCVTTIVDADHARNMAKWAGVNYLAGNSFKPFYIPAEWKVVMSLGFFCVGEDFERHMRLFGDPTNEDLWKKNVKKVIYWTGGDVFSLRAGLNYDVNRFICGLINDKFDKHLCATPLIKKQLDGTGIDAEIVKLPYQRDFGLLPLPRKFTVAIYLPVDPPGKNMGQQTLQIADKLRGIKFLAYGATKDCPHQNLPKNITYVGPQWDDDWGKFIGKCSVFFNLRTYGPIANAHVDFAIAGRKTLTNIEDMPGVIKLPDHRETTKHMVVLEAAINELKKAKKQYKHRLRDEDLRNKYLKAHSPEVFGKNLNRIMREVM